MNHMMENIDTLMTPSRESFRGEAFVVVHPLFDIPEQKLDVAQMGPMKLSRIARIALASLRFYLIAMILLAGYRVLEFAGCFK